MVGYIAIGAPNPLLQNYTEWCEICQRWWHAMHNYTMLNKYQKTNHTPFREFYKIVGHDRKKCRALYLIREKSSNVYRMKEEEASQNVAP